MVSPEKTFCLGSHDLPFKGETGLHSGSRTDPAIRMKVTFRPRVAPTFRSFSILAYPGWQRRISRKILNFFDFSVARDAIEVDIEGVHEDADFLMGSLR